ncbi:hypothetical protein [Bacillus pumilus]|uniref:hypothetical protein n=1 Tax=Bacillus pumilus TaxID=1408 RepID=UPI0021B23C28|nr:hypothetical protein [Bacillus pumilus]
MRIIGGGVVGRNGGKMGIGVGGDVSLIDVKGEGLGQLEDEFGDEMKRLMCNPVKMGD